MARRARDWVRSLGVSGAKTITIDLSPIADAIDEIDSETAISRETRTLIDAVAGQMYDFLLEDGPREVARQEKYRKAFERRLRQTWGSALVAFDLVHALSQEFGADLNNEFRPRAAAENDLVFEALTRLHGRACLTTSEIGALLRSGHATGANTRWRTLNELATVSLFISQNGQVVAKRFLAHRFAEMYRGAKLYRKFAERLGLEPLEDAEFETLRESVDQLEKEYGPRFCRPYGWARDFVSGTPSLATIAAAINMEHWAPYVHMASHGVHSGPQGFYFDLGLPDPAEAIAAGASHFGLADPGQGALISLGQVTVALFSHCLKLTTENHGDTDDIVEGIVRGLLMSAEMLTLHKLIGYGVNLFVSIDAGIDEDAAELGNPPRLMQPLRWS